MSDTLTTEIVWMVFKMFPAVFWVISITGAWFCSDHPAIPTDVVNCSIKNPGKEFREKGVYFLNNAIHKYTYANPPETYEFRFLIVFYCDVCLFCLQMQPGFVHSFDDFGCLNVMN